MARRRRGRTASRYGGAPRDKRLFGLAVVVLVAALAGGALGRRAEPRPRGAAAALRRAAACRLTTGEDRRQHHPEGRAAELGRADLDVAALVADDLSHEVE